MEYAYFDHCALSPIKAILKILSYFIRRSQWIRSTALFGFLGMLGIASALEYPIGQPQELHGIEISAVYLQPIMMEPKGMMRPVEESDIHLEADIRALEDNPNGFAEGDFVPYLNIRYEIRKHGSEKIQKGKLVPMVANDGPHYGSNVKLQGPGRYTVIYYISPPSQQVDPYFGRHTDRETGVQRWFSPFSVKNIFVYAGVGKKGGY